MKWPEPENKRIPEGHYQFRLNREPELIPITITDKDGNKRESRRLKLYVRGIGPQGEFGAIDSFVPWEERYTDLCKALHVDHGRDIQMEGAVFEADIEYQIDGRDPTKSYSRIVRIVVPAEGEGDDVPF
jgi:hypothetical protein